MTDPAKVGRLGRDLYPAEAGEDWIEFDSMINVRPSQETTRFVEI